MQQNIRPLFGLEFEVSFAALNDEGRRIDSTRVLRTFMKIAAARFRHLPARESSGIFLANGGRLYIDCGKPEITTPEVTCPDEACRYARAGEAILLEVCDEVVRQMPEVAKIILTRCNVSYGGSGSAWACHESYGHRCRGNLARDFLPHALSRIIYTGAGGFDSRRPGMRFLLSPRVAHLRASSSENTQHERGIYNTKEEPLCGGGYRRLHVICGENVSSNRAQWLKMATTAVVVAMAQAGMRPGEGLQVTDPLYAMRQFAEDATLTASVQTVNGRSVTALDIQRELLRCATRLQVVGPLNDWLPACCRLWEDTLERLEQGPTGVRRSVDWAIKLDLFRNYVRRRGLSWDQLQRWQRVFDKLQSGARAEEVDLDVLSKDENSRRRQREIRTLQRRLDPSKQCDWDQLELVLQVRQELFELDTRFGQLGEGGIFESLDVQGLVDHQISGLGDVRRAMTEPPRVGRARLRGEAIARLGQHEDTAACEWDAVWDYAGDRRLDLSDPFADEASWAVAEPGRSPRECGAATALRALSQAIALYDRGEYESASRLLRIASGWLSLRGQTVPRDASRFMAWIRARCGYADGATWLDALDTPERRPLTAICDYLLVYRFEGLRPGAALARWCEAGLAQFAVTAHPSCRDAVVLYAAHAFDLLCRNRPGAAWDVYHREIRPEWMQAIDARLTARLHAERGETLRRLQRVDEAREQLHWAREIQMAGQINGDLADLTLTPLAKIAAGDGLYHDAWQMLSHARQIQRDAANVVGEARSLLLMARLSTAIPGRPCDLVEIRERIGRLRDTRPALARCCLAAQICHHWDHWIGGGMLEETEDAFWGL